MRPELDILEKIDTYLGGTMSNADKAIFENQIANDPGLKSMVQDQQLLIKTVNRQAILADINSVMGTTGTTAWYSQISTWVITGILATGIITGLVYYNMDETEQIVQTIEEEDITAEYEEELIELADVIEVEEIVVPTVIPVVNNVPTIAFIPLPEIIEKEELAVEILNPVIEDVDNQSIEEEEEESLTLVKRNRDAMFKEGSLAMDRYFKKRLKFPGTAKLKKIEGKVRVDFYVFADGHVQYTRIKCINMSSIKNDKPFGSLKVMFNRKVRKLFENDAEVLFRNMPDWDPATDSHGNPQLTPMTIFINYDIDGSHAYGLEFDDSDGEYKRLNQEILNQ